MHLYFCASLDLELAYSVSMRMDERSYLWFEASMKGRS